VSRNDPERPSRRRPLSTTGRIICGDGRTKTSDSVPSSGEPMCRSARVEPADRHSSPLLLRQTLSMEMASLTSGGRTRPCSATSDEGGCPLTDEVGMRFSLGSFPADLRNRNGPTGVVTSTILHGGDEGMGGSRLLHELYYASYNRLVLQMFALCGDLADAEDAVQEAFVKAIGKGRAFDRVQNPEAWLRTVALNHQRNSWRHAKVVRRFVAGVPGPQVVPEMGPDHVAVMGALAGLDPSQREVIVLYYLADLGVAEIAFELGVPEGTVKSRLSRGRERLAFMLDEREESDHV
jgi:RNA polymerase sigma-70 factor (ECF subfamily)